MATFPYGLDPLTWPPDGEPPDCCTGESLGANVQYMSIGAQKAKCGTPPIAGLSGGDKGSPIYRQPAEGPPKFFLVVTETAGGSCRAGPGCYGYDPEGESQHDSSSGSKTSRTNPRSSGPYWAPYVVHVEGEIHDNCGIWFYVNWSFNWSETSYTVNRSEGEPPPGYCKVLGSSNYSLELSEEFDTGMLEAIVGELLSACPWDEMQWGENKLGMFRAEEMICEGGWRNDGPGWNNTAYRKLRDDESVLTKRRLRYKVSGQVFPAPKGGSFRIRWREMFLPEVGADEDPAPTFTDREYTGAPADGETTIDAAEYTIEPPETNGSVLVVGLPATGTISARIEVKGWALTKRGFLEYKPTGDKPRVFKRETASGGFAGCPNLDPKSYSGFQRFTDEEVTVKYPGGSYKVLASDDPTGNNEETLSDDVKESGLFSPSFPSGGDFRFTMPVKQVTPTQRTFEQSYSSGEDAPVKDTLHFDLSEEYTLQEMVAAVETECSKAWDDRRKKFVSDPDSGRLQAALLFQSADESAYAKQQMRYKLTFSIPWSFATAQSFTFKWKIYTYHFDTGATTEEAMSQSVTFEDGNTAITDEDWREIPAPSVRVWIGGFEGPEHALFYERDPKIERV